MSARKIKRRDLISGRPSQAKANNQAEYQVITFLEKKIRPYWRQFAWALFLLIVSGVALGRFMESRRALAAAGYRRLDTADSVEELRILAAEYETRPIAALARLRKGEKLLEANQYEEAIAAFRMVESEFSDPRYLIPARLGLGYALEAEGRKADAMQTFQKLASLPETDLPTRIAAWFGVGRNAFALDRMEPAKQAFETVLELVDEGYYASQSRQLLQQIELAR